MEKNTMKALVYQKPGRANGGVIDVPVPEYKDDEILIKVMASSICKPADKNHDGKGSVIGRYPVTPGHEFAGIVEEVGANVTNFKPGDRITADNGTPCGKCYYCQRAMFTFCENFSSMGQNTNGAMAQYAVVKECNAVHVPGHVSLKAASLCELIGCAMRCIENADLKVGDVVAIFGVGASGNLITQLALHSNAQKVVVFDCIQSKLDRVSAKGAIPILVDLDDYSKHEKEFLRMFPHGANVVIDTTGDAELMNRCPDLMACEGKFIGYSFPTTSKRHVKLDMGKFIMKQLTYMGSNFQSHHFQRCVDALANGVIDASIVITHTYPLEDYFEALDTNIQDPECVKVTILPNGSIE
ncbi:MAG: alcohol dehydrogenase catalytic domain-containing protein [Lachnospiraceae bacterium]|jgi:D-arabinitol dehydrogenase (NADP+)|nr:alcohol dehydrogenase catalytic domain-containing protein [Lachnospiraceae bacterium]